MPWIWLSVASVLEVVWVLTIKATEGYTNTKVSIVSTLIVLINLYVLSRAFQQLPMATAYAIWTGASAVGVVVCGFIFYGESFNFIKCACIGFIVIGIMGLRSVTDNL